MGQSEMARRERSRQCMKRIAEATAPLIRELGYEELTVREICANAGITTGMFYRHFVSKDDVLSYCYIQELKALLSTVDERLAGRPLAEQIVMLMTEVMTVNRHFGPGSVYMFLNRRTESTSGSWQMRDLLKGELDRLIANALMEGFRLSPGRDPENIYRDVSTLVKGCVTDWYMTGFDDIAVRTQELLSRLVPHLL